MQVKLIKANETFVGCDGKPFVNAEDASKNYTLGQVLYMILREDRSEAFSHMRLAELGTEFCNKEEVKLSLSECAALEKLINASKGPVSAINCGLALLQLTKSETVDL